MLHSHASGSQGVLLPAIPPLRVLVVIASPNDLPRFDAEQHWRLLTETLTPLTEQGSVVLRRVEPATETAIKSLLDDESWHVFHFIGHGRGRAAQYSTVVLENSEGRSRAVNERYLAQLVKSNSSLRLFVFQPGEASSELRLRVDTLTQGGSAAAITTGLLGAPAQRIFLSKLYAGILLQLDPKALLSEVCTALAAARSDTSGLTLASEQPDVPLFAPLQPACSADAPSFVPQAAATAAVGTRETNEAAASVKVAAELERKRAACQFDVFLCHNGADKPAVKRIGQWLKTRGVLPWLDVWELPPGRPWQVLLEKQIGHIKSAAVLVGSAGVGPWQEQELYGFLREFVSRNCPVIPVLLPDAPAMPPLPLFLRAMTWVDFRSQDPDPYEQLFWGITGVRPTYN